ncbi:MAG: T9SS type A sorting domain-containing protein [Sporocytophaga sp.]|uniref:T9SS type A sorting domain-containing protein n=1 Tax=Sporocytophaga sp. TaxID=2231183 RepID=UPI001B0B39C8|nr:T9SS type A sorting domain-containing protein [Sporocytophaga sp.]MBO9700977.1 T9SS type A sorting domain-containing protein [Sporocytophaga sp.]
MRKQLLLSIVKVLFGGMALAQTSGTFIAADNGNRMSSCADTLITLENIYTQCGIKDLNDPEDNVSNYRLLQLNGSVITTTEITGGFKYSDYEMVYIEKQNTPANGHNGIAIFINIIQPPTKYFIKDTLKYTVEKGAKVNFSKDFFSNIAYWGTGKDTEEFHDRLFLYDGVNPETAVKNLTDWTLFGKGTYRIRLSYAICSADDIHSEEMYVKVEESPCHNLELRNMPSICLDDILDIRPYVYLDGHVATAEELADMTFLDKSDNAKPSDVLPINPAAIDLATMWKYMSTKFPRIEISYQPNITLGICNNYYYNFVPKVPTKLMTTDVIMSKDSYGGSLVYMIDGDYYGFNNVFHKNVLKEIYLDHNTNHNGTEFSFFTDDKYENLVTGNDLSPGDYYVLATNPECNEDSTSFKIRVLNRDFEITWQNALNMGKGYYTFTAPSDYPGATYSWFAWGGEIVSGINTNQITVYYSEKASKGVTVSCTITLPTARVSGNSVLASGLYLTSNEAGEKEEIQAEIITGNTNIVENLSSVYPNPSEGKIVISGKGQYDLKIYNALGQLIHEDNAYTPETPLDLEGKGMHMIRLIQNGKVQTLKAIVK